MKKSIYELYDISETEAETVIKRYFDTENNLIISKFPSKPKKKIIILHHLIKEFEKDKKYSEDDVNTILSKFYSDYATVRRALVDYGFLQRENNGSIYWVENYD